ncbi:MAG: hypothetical protein ACHQAY_20465 [Hyphomicrobiales bacterium]
MRAWLIGSLLAALANGAAQAADFSTLRGEIADAAPSAAQPSPFTVGVRYWYSTGRHDYSFNGSIGTVLIGGTIYRLGNPTSELTYADIPAHTGEVFGRYTDAETGLVIKGYVGGGGFADGGTMNDRDWVEGQRLFSNTNSSLKASNLRYLTLDIGWGADYLTFGNLQFLPFLGYGHWHDGVGTWGLTQLPDDFGGAAYGTPAGTVFFTNNQKVGGYVASWHMVRLGAEGTLSITPQLTITVDGAFVPYAQGNGDDSHLLRQDELGSKPNVFLRGHGWGGQVDALVHYQVTNNFSVGIGGRYWYIDASSGYKTDRIDNLFGGPRLPLTTFTTERYGLLAEAAYKF